MTNYRGYLTTLPYLLQRLLSSKQRQVTWQYEMQNNDIYNNTFKNVTTY